MSEHDAPHPSGAEAAAAAAAYHAASDTDVPPQEIVASPLADGEWHRLHPLTPLLRGGIVLLVVIGIVISNLQDRLIYLFFPGVMGDVGAEEWEEWADYDDPIDWLWANELAIYALLAVLGVLLLCTAWFYLSWRFHQFRITSDVEVKSGILFRTQRRAPLDRVQGVNLTRPMIARIFGLAKLEVMGAGAEGNVKLEYLATPKAEAVRADILRLASGRKLAKQQARDGAAGTVSRGAAWSDTVQRGLHGLIEGEDLDAPEPESVVHIPASRVIWSNIISPNLLFLLAILVAIIIGASTTTPWLLFSFIPALIGFGSYWVSLIFKSLRYAIAPTPDGVRITSGLLTTETYIVPPGRIHAVQISQSIMWRPFGWWRVQMNRLSGASATDQAASGYQGSMALPVGTIEDVDRVLRLLLPSVPPEDWPDILVPGMTGTGSVGGYATTPRRAWFIRPLSWKRNGLRLRPGILLMRRGLLWRKLALVPFAREQSVGISQGPVDRWTRVASLQAHVVAGPVYPNVAAIDRTTAVQVFTDVADAAVQAAADDHSHRWGEWVDERGAALGAPEPERAEGTEQPEAVAPTREPEEFDERA